MPPIASIVDRTHAGGARTLRLAVATAFMLGALTPLAAPSAPAPPRFDGFNVIATPKDPFGSVPAILSLAKAKQAGAGAVAVIPFLWQAKPSSPDITRGADMPDDELRAAIRDAHALGLAVVVKPHVWVPQSWAGTVAMESEADWQRWFANYRQALDRIARIAEDEKAEALAIGTELEKTTQRPEWQELIADVRHIYAGRLLYVAHGVEEADSIPFWKQLDLIGVSLYPPLGADADRTGQRARMDAVAKQLDALSARTGKSILVAEVGLRSAVGAAAMPWQSVEERASAPDPDLQASVLGDWLSVLDRPEIRGVLIWRWFTDPDAGGPNDTDFTIQNKPAENIVRCAWKGECTPQAMSTD